jgi:hypothetical protein
MKLFSTTRKEKVYISIGIIIASLAIGYGTWRDLHPAQDPIAAQGSFNRTYYVADQSHLEHVPQDNYALVALAGTYTHSKDKDGFASSDIIPVNFPQREADLLFRLDGIPAKLSPLYEAIDEKIDQWHGENNFFNTLYLQDVNPDDSLESQDNLFVSIRNHLKGDYSLNVFIRRADLEKMEKPGIFLENMNKNVWMFIFDEKEAKKPDESLAQMILDLEKYQAPFLVAIHKTPDIETLYKTIQDKAKHFQGFLLMTADTMKQDQLK